MSTSPSARDLDLVVNSDDDESMSDSKGKPSCWSAMLDMSADPKGSMIAAEGNPLDDYSPDSDDQDIKDGLLEAAVARSAPKTKTKVRSHQAAVKPAQPKVKESSLKIVLAAQR